MTIGPHIDINGPGLVPIRPMDAYLGRLLRRTILPLAFATCYALLLANLPIDAFLDRVNYFVYASSSDIIASRYSGDPKAFFANEPLWLLMNIILSEFLNSEQVVRFFIFAPAFSVSFLLVRKEKSNAIWLVIFLLMPAVIKNFIIHIRQGVAIAIFMAGYYSKSKSVRSVLWASTPFVHSSFFFILMLAGINYATTILRFPVWLRVIFFILCYLATALLMEVIASGVGARQILEYQGAEIVVSGLGFMFWSAVFLMFLTSGPAFIRQHSLPVSILAFYLGSYFIVPFAARILESGLLMILATGLALERWRRPAFLSMLSFFILLVYFLQRNEPWFGWGV